MKVLENPIIRRRQIKNAVSSEDLFPLVIIHHFALLDYSEENPHFHPKTYSLECLFAYRLQVEPPTI